jgi:hypothetical protein
MPAKPLPNTRSKNKKHKKKSTMTLTHNNKATKTVAAKKNFDNIGVGVKNTKLKRKKDVELNKDVKITGNEQTRSVKSTKRTINNKFDRSKDEKVEVLNASDIKNKGINVKSLVNKIQIESGESNNKKPSNNKKIKSKSTIEDIILLKRKMNREIFNRCLEKKLLSVMDSWEEK